MDAFLASLSPVQQAMFTAQLQSAASPLVQEETPPTPMTVDASPLLTATWWFSSTASRATEVEVLLLVTLLTMSLGTPEKLDAWLELAATDAVRMSDLHDQWAPLQDSMIYNSGGKVLEPLERALHAKLMADSGDGSVETASAVIASWAARYQPVSPSSIDAYLKRLLKKPKKSRLAGPTRDGGKSASARHVSAIPSIVGFLRDHYNRRRLRHSIAVNEVHAMREVRFTKAELLEQMEVEQEAELKAEQAKTTAAMAQAEAAKAKAEATQGRLDTAVKAKSKAQIRAQKSEDSRKGTAKRVRGEERSNAKEREAAIRETAKVEADAALKAKAKRKQELATAAHREKREWKRRAETAEELAAQRQAKLNSMDEVDEGDLNDEANDAVVTARLHADAYAKLQAMPTWRRVRGKGSGRGGAKLEDSHREAIYSMFAKQVPLSAISGTIISLVKRTAPWLNPALISNASLTNQRFELRFMEQYMAARKVAAAFRIRMLGFDETTKDGDPSITSNVIIEPTEGALLEPVILIGAYCSAGGTAEKIAAAIETKCFAKLRDFLRRVEAKFRELYPAEQWTGPKPEDLSMARLSGGGGIQSDTCNTAEKAKEILADMISKGKREMIGEEAWAKLSAEQQQEVTRVHKLDCHQHMRNIFLKEMSKAQAAHVAAELKPHLDAFSAWDRVTTDYTQLLRASYKELHHGNKYAAAHPAHPTTSPGARGTRWPARQANALPYEDPCAHPERPPFTPPIPAIPHVRSCA